MQKFKRVIHTSNLCLRLFFLRKKNRKRELYKVICNFLVLRIVFYLIRYSYFFLGKKNRNTKTIAIYQTLVPTRKKK